MVDFNNDLDQMILNQTNDNLIEKIQPNEDAIALIFAEKYKNTFRYDHTIGQWYVWTGSYWKLEQTKLAFTFARNLLRKFNEQHNEKSLPKVLTARNVETFSSCDHRLTILSDEWNLDIWKMATPDFTIDLKTGEKLDNNPNDLISKCTSISPGDVNTPLWDRFLNDCCDGNTEFKRFLQQVAGYCLTGDIREHAIFFIYGTGRNGKSVFINTLTTIMDGYAKVAAMETFILSKYDRHSTELANLHGSRLVTASETEQGRAWAESRIKQLSGGDPISARFMRKDFFEFHPEFKLLFIGNHKPVLHNTDPAERRRFYILPFIYQPKTPDKNLSDKLIAEYPGILQWAIDGCLDWQKNGLVVPQNVKDETDDYFQEQNLFGQWLSENTEKTESTVGETTSHLFKSWCRFVDAQGEKGGTQIKFSQNLLKSGFNKTKHVPGQNNKRGFKGIRLIA